MRRRSPAQIKHLLAEQTSGEESIAEFCWSRRINAGTFYAWRVKYATGKQTVSAPQGFTRLVTSSSVAAAPPQGGSRATTVHLPSGARLELTNWPLADLLRLARELCPGDA